MEKEIWKDVVGYEGLYQVSSEGRIKNRFEKIIKTDGISILFSRCKRKKIDFVVAQAFLPEASVMECVRHKNGNELDCCVDNLEWDSRTKKEKISDTMRIKQSKRTEVWRENGNIIEFRVANIDEYGLCDIEDWGKIKNHSWYKNQDGYLITNIDKKPVRLHYLILPKKEGYVVDHANRNRLDNRKSNLRYATNRANAINREKPCNNRTGRIGVGFSTRLNKYIAYININKKRKQLGKYNSLEEAIMVREEAEEKYYKPIIEKETHI